MEFGELTESDVLISKQGCCGFEKRAFPLALALRLLGKKLASHPIPRSDEDSSGVPQMRQITAEQSPQVRGSVISRAQLGQ